MSGGVDSSATAYLLQKQGYAVEGVYMHNWDTRDETGQCTSERDWADVQRTCSHLRIRCRRVDLVRDYWTEVFDPMLADYGRGWTPNPDVMCNRHIKFGRLLDLLEDDLAGGDCWLATGHYARIRPPSSSLKTPELLRGVDPDKDQSYFLSSLGSGQLRTVLFPLGSLLKSQVKTIAIEEAGMAWLRNRKESMGICMVGKRKRFSEFLGQQTNGAGHFAVLADSEDVRGAPVHLLKDTEPSRYLTIGQSARIPGRRSKHYVAQKIVPLDTVVVVPDHDHPALFRSSLTIHDWRWVRREVGPAMLRISAQTCYRDTMRLATLRVRQSGRMPDRLEATIEFDEPVRGAALGQWVAAYHGDLVLGGGTVSGLGPWEWTMASELDVEQAARTMLQT
ncbi:tRNA methyl transferase [Hyaloraphidium curvatum]|nr:tRNA methyl transferase [Hyaloraphidium curvatum]